MKKLNIGCGKETIEGFVNLDIIQYDNVDVVHNLTKIKYPFEDNTFDLVYGRCILEHICPLKLIEVINELHRITKHNGRLIFIVPYGYFSNVWIGHTKCFTFATFENLIKASKIGYEVANRFELIKFEQYPFTIGKFIPNDFLRKKLSYLFNFLIKKIGIELKVIKDSSINPKLKRYCESIKKRDSDINKKERGRFGI